MDETSAANPRSARLAAALQPGASQQVGDAKRSGPRIEVRLLEPTDVREQPAGDGKAVDPFGIARLELAHRC